jgi:hypothetical protein
VRALFAIPKAGCATPSNQTPPTSKAFLTMKAGGIVAVAMTIFLFVAFKGGNAQNWTETVTVPVKETTTLTASHFASYKNVTALESVRVTGATCLVITSACISSGGAAVGATFRTSCLRLWIVYSWQACPSAATVWAYSPCPGMKYCAIAN